MFYKIFWGVCVVVFWLFSTNTLSYATTTTQTVAPVSITVTPVQSKIRPGENVSLKVVAEYPGKRVDVTTSWEVSYVSSNTNIATVTSTWVVNANRYWAANATKFSITATYKWKTAVSNFTSVMITDFVATPDFMEIYPWESQQINAYFPQSDGSIIDVTYAPTTIYTSANTKIATVGTSWLVTAPSKLAFGSSNNLLTHITVTNEKGNSREVEVRVLRGNTPKIDNIILTPNRAILSSWQTLPLKLEITWTDGIVRDVTSDTNTIYTSSSGALASVDSKWLVTAWSSILKETNITVTATYKWLSRTVIIKVLPLKVIWISVTPKVATLDLWGTLNLTVMATSTDKAKTDVTSQCTYKSSDESLLTVDSTGKVIATQTAFTWSKSVTVYITKDSFSTQSTISIKGTKKK